MQFDWGYAFAQIPILLQGAVITLYVTIGGLFFGFIVGVIFGVMRLSRNRTVYGIATAYVEAIRGTPLLVQALYIYFGFNQILHGLHGPLLGKLAAGIIVISINAGAYIAEIVRGGIQSIDKGQTEAGRSLGLTGLQTFRYVIWPQAFKRIIPPLGNQFIISLKDTSLLAMIGLGELTRHGNEAASTEFAYFEVFTIVAAMYLVLTLTISFVLRRVERRLDV